MKSLLLLVGSDPSATDVLGHLFANRYRTVACGSADEALAYLESTSVDDRPALVLCDQTSGEDRTPLSLFRGLKNDHKNDTLPAVVLLDEQDRTKLTDLGWAGALPKPFNPEGLALCVRQILSAHQ